jgi:probable F420-dependent oxidoreductase
MRFHQAIQFLPLETVRALTLASDQMGYDGVYLSDHLFNPRVLESKYTYSTAPDGAPFWEKETEWPDPMCLVSALSSVTTTVTFTTGIYIAPVRDLITVAKSVGTAAVLSDNRVRLGVGVGWCKEEYVQTGQDFHNRGKRLDDMIPALRALWQGGWVEYHGSHYDVPECQMNPAPTLPVPILGGGDSVPALRRASTLCDGWINTGAVFPDEAFEQVTNVRKALHEAGRDDGDFAIYMAVKAFPDLDLYKKLEDAGVTDLLCAPWMLAEVDESDSPEKMLAARLAEVEKYAEEYVAKMR